MSGRVKRKAAIAAAAANGQIGDAPPACALCGRALGRRIEWHHRIPRSRGGSEVVPVHPICHRAIHAAVSNHDLAAGLADLAALREHPDIARFVSWVADKPADFHAPTRRSRRD